MAVCQVSIDPPPPMVSHAQSYNTFCLPFTISPRSIGARFAITHVDGLSPGMELISIR